MSFVTDAVYEDGVLRPIAPLPCRDRDVVRITVEAAAGWTERTAGILRWTGDPAELRRLALDPAFDPQSDR